MHVWYVFPGDMVANVTYNIQICRTKSIRAQDAKKILVEESIEIKTT